MDAKREDGKCPGKFQEFAENLKDELEKATGLPVVMTVLKVGYLKLLRPKTWLETCDCPSCRLARGEAARN